MSSLSAERHARQGGRSGSSLAGLQNPLVYLSHGLHAASKHTTRQNTVTLYVQSEELNMKIKNTLTACVLDQKHSFSLIWLMAAWQSSLLDLIQTARIAV